MAKLVEFTPPKGLAVPENKAEGDTFESMATFRIKKGGRMCLVAIGDYEMPGYIDKPDEGSEVVSKYHAVAPKY